MVLYDEDIKCNQHVPNTQAAPHSGAGIRYTLQSITPVEEITGLTVTILTKGGAGRRQLHIIGHEGGEKVALYLCEDTCIMGCGYYSALPIQSTGGVWLLFCQHKALKGCGYYSALPAHSIGGGVTMGAGHTNNAKTWVM